RRLDGTDAADLRSRPPRRASHRRLRGAKRILPRVSEHPPDAEATLRPRRSVATLPEHRRLVPLARRRALSRGGTTRWGGECLSPAAPLALEPELELSLELFLNLLMFPLLLLR